MKAFLSPPQVKRNQKCKTAVNINLQTSWETPSGEDFMNFSNAAPAPRRAQRPHPPRLCRDEYQSPCSPGARILFSDCFTHFTTIDFPFHSRKQHKAEARMHPQSFSSCISFDLIIQENRIKPWECTAIVCLHAGGRDNDHMHVIWVFLSIYGHGCTSCMCPQLHVCQCVWPYVPMSFYIFVNISELIGKWCVPTWVCRCELTGPSMHLFCLCLYIHSSKWMNVLTWLIRSVLECVWIYKPAGTDALNICSTSEAVTINLSLCLCVF